MVIAREDLEDSRRTLLEECAVPVSLEQTHPVGEQYSSLRTCRRMFDVLDGLIGQDLVSGILALPAPLRP